MTAKEAKALTKQSIEDNRSTKQFGKLFDKCMLFIEQRAKAGYFSGDFDLPFFYQTRVNALNLESTLKTLKYNASFYDRYTGMGVSISWDNVK